MNGIYLIIGGNIGNRLKTLDSCRHEIEERIGSITAQSSIYETAAWGQKEQNSFLNQVLLIRTNSDPMNLMKACLEIEQRMGRKRAEKWAPRTIDIDILFYHDEILHVEGLTLPHPRIHERRFVLTPLNELAAQEIHPSFNKTIHELLEDCKDDLEVIKLSPLFQTAQSDEWSDPF